MEEAVEWLKGNQNSLVELTMATNSYLTAEDRKKLYAVHEGIVSFIPDVQNKDEWIRSTRTDIDLNKNMEDLFKDYFKHAKGQEPGKTMMDLFKEVLSEEEAQ